MPDAALLAAVKFHPKAQVPGSVPPGSEPKPPVTGADASYFGLVKPGIAAARLEMVNGR